MKFLIVGGFLGSGKTSFILHLARYLVQERGYQKVVILENEVGKVSVDDKLLESAGYQVQGIFAGCVCCTMAGELTVNVRKLQQDIDPDWIIMEATGMAFPGDIPENLDRYLDNPSQVTCLVDAKRWRKLSAAMPDLLVHQLSGAHKVLVNKVDLVTPEDLQWIKESIAQFNGTASIETFSTLETIPQEILARIVDWEG